MARATSFSSPRFDYGEEENCPRPQPQASLREKCADGRLAFLLPGGLLLGLGRGFALGGGPWCRSAAGGRAFKLDDHLDLDWNAAR